MRASRLILLCTLLTTGVSASPVPGTQVDIVPPAGFTKADRFAGFMNATTGASIVVTDIPGAFREVTAGFHDPARMQAQGMEVLDRTELRVDKHEAVLLHVTQEASGILFDKWLLAVDRNANTTLVVATYPHSVAEQQSEPLKAALLGVTFGEPGDPLSALPFRVTAVAPLQPARVIGNVLIMSPQGQFPVTDESVPFLLVGRSISPGEGGGRQLAEERVARAVGVQRVAIEHTDPVTIGALSGFVTVAQAVSAQQAIPLKVYQAMLFEPQGYVLIQGITPAEQQQTYLPLFEQVAQSLTLR